MTGRSPAITGRRRRGGRRWSRPSRSSSRTAAGAVRSPSPSSAPPAPQGAEALAPGSEVEVRVDADGFHGSWFEAVVEGFSPARGRRAPSRYTATYTHLLSEDGSTLVEPFAPSHVRPRPPPRGSSEEDEEPFQLHDIVEAFHNDGWWSGIVLATEPLTVSFPITREVIAFPPDQVRHRRDYVDGQWVKSPVAMVIHPRLAVKVYEAWDKVEVVRERELYGYSWFPAMVVKAIDTLSYLVEYLDLEEGGDKAVEYLHWQLIRPSVEHFPQESEFHLVPGAAVEAYCDGAWSPGVVSKIVGEGEYEVTIEGNDDLLLTKVRELLKPRYRWTGKVWKIVSSKRQRNRRQSSSTKRPSSPVILVSSDDEHEGDTGFSAIKRSRKELQQQEVTLTEGSEHVSETEMDTPLSAFCKSPSSNHPRLSETSNLKVLSHKIVSSFIPTNGLLDASSGHPTPQTEPTTNAIGETVVNHQEILSECQIDSLDCGTSSVELPAAELLKQKMASAESDSATQQTQEMPLFVQALQVKKYPSKHKLGEMRPILSLEGKNDISDNAQIQLKGSNNCSGKEIICALNASIVCSTPSAQIKRLKVSDMVSRRANSGSNRKVLASKKLSKKKDFRESSSLHDLLDATSTAQTRGRNKVAVRQKKSSAERQLKMGGPCTRTRRQLDRTLEDKMNTSEASDEKFFPIIPPGFKATCNGQGLPLCSADGMSEIDIHSSLLDEDQSAMANDICLADQNADALTDYAASQVAEINGLMGNSIISLVRSVQQDGGGVDMRPMLQQFQNAVSSQFTIDDAFLRRCSVAGSSIPPHMPLCQISNQKLLFMKTSPVWSLIEAMEVFQKVPQRPHFLSLEQFLPALREGMAIGLMVSYASLVESTKRSRMEDSIQLFEEKISTLNHFEENGFDVQTLKSSLSKLLKVKSDHKKYLEDRDKLKEKLHEEEVAMSQIDARLNENNQAISHLEQELECLHRKAEEISRDKEEKGVYLAKLEEEDDIIETACGDAKQLFRSIVADLR